MCMHYIEGKEYGKGDRTLQPKGCCGERNEIKFRGKINKVKLEKKISQILLLNLLLFSRSIRWF